jgi:4-amino-4-deoxy-L-arabinose transferase-like glycosyltransferase
MNIKKDTFLLCLTLVVSIYMIFFYLGQSPLQTWDESRHGASALEMLQHHAYILNTYEGKNDYWNLKPPLSFWAIALSVSTFGKSIFSIRLASALSSTALFIIIAWFMRARYGAQAATISLILLISCSRLFIFHGFRSADPDAMYLFCMVTGTLLTLPPSSTLKLTLAAFLGALAFLLKSWHACCLGIPFMLFYGWAIYQKSLKWRQVLYPALAFIIPILLWVSLRYSADGWIFFQQAWDIDLLHSLSNTDRMTHPFNNMNLSHRTAFYYLQLLLWNELPLVLALCASLYAWLTPENRKKNISCGLPSDLWILFITACFAFLLYSLSTSRHEWYMYYSLILWCIFTGACLSKSVEKKAIPLFSTGLVFLLAIFFFKYVAFIQANPSRLYYQQLTSLSKADSFDYLIMPHWPESMALFKPYHSQYVQSEYLAVLIFTPFTIERIQSDFTGGHALLMKRKEDKSLNPSECHLLSPGDEFDFYDCQSPTLQKGAKYNVD